MRFVYELNKKNGNKPKRSCIRCIRVLGFFASEWISVAKSAKLRKSATEKRDPKKHLSLSVAVRD